MEIKYSVVIKIATPPDPFNLYMKIHNTLTRISKQVEVVDLCLGMDNPDSLDKRFIRGTTRLGDVEIVMDTYRKGETDIMVTEIEVIGKDKNKVEKIATEIGKALLSEDASSQGGLR